MQYRKNRVRSNGHPTGVRTCAKFHILARRHSHVEPIKVTEVARVNKEVAAWYEGAVTFYFVSLVGYPNTAYPCGVPSKPIMCTPHAFRLIG